MTSMVRSCGESWREDAIEFQGFSLPRVWVNVKSWQILLSLILAPAVVALHTTGMTGEGRGVTFSEKFLHAYAAATVDQTNAKCIGKLNAMREEFVKPEEVAEIELTLGVIYGQRTGLRDPVKAVPHFTKALNHDLPPPRARGSCSGGAMPLNSRSGVGRPFPITSADS